MFEILPVNDKRILAFKASGRLTDADYREFLPRLEGLIRQSGQISLYIELEDFQGWEPKAAWDDLRFGVQHDRDFSRIAIVGDGALEHSAVALANLFTHTRMRYFDREEAKAAWDWLEDRTQEKQARHSVQPYRKLLLATDFSLFSEYAAQRAGEIARLYDAQLEVLHIIEEIIFNYADYDPVIPDIPLRDDVLEEQAHERMRKFVDCAGLGQDVRLELQWGNPKWSILSRALEQEVDLIVMGSHGHRGVERL